MKTPIYVLKLNGPTSGTASAAAPAPDKTLVGTSERNDLNNIPATGNLILYVVGHAVPDGLIDAEGEIVTEASVAKAIREKRNDKPTVIVWDVCYAASFLDAPDCKEWGSQYVHIFACQDYELTWHGSDGTTQFSQELLLAVTALNRGQKTQNEWSWDALEDKLQTQFGTLQIPDVVASKGAPSPRDFQLYDFVSAESS